MNKMDAWDEVNEREYERQVSNAHVLYYIWFAVLRPILNMIIVTAVGAFSYMYKKNQVMLQILWCL